MEELNQLLGNPLTFYEDFVIKFDEGLRKLQEHKKGQERSQDVGCMGQDRAFE
jgi:hypothetical protein